MGDEDLWLEFETEVELVVVCMVMKMNVVFTNLCNIGKTKCTAFSVPPNPNNV